MSPLAMTILWAVLLVLFVVIEAVTVQLVSIWFAVGALGGLICNLFGLSQTVQIIEFVVVSIIALILTRPLVNKFTRSNMQKTNADRVIGSEAMVIEKINNIESKGSVKANGNVWTARSSDNTIIPVDTVVVVEKIEGVKLIVKIK